MCGRKAEWRTDWVPETGHVAPTFTELRSRFSESCSREGIWGTEGGYAWCQVQASSLGSVTYQMGDLPSPCFSFSICRRG